MDVAQDCVFALPDFVEVVFADAQLSCQLCCARSWMAKLADEELITLGIFALEGVETLLDELAAVVATFDVVAAIFEVGSNRRELILVSEKLTII